MTIGGSTFYYFIVMWTEIAGALFPQLACHFLSGGKLGADDYEEEDQIERASAFEMSTLRNVGAQIMEVDNARLSDTGIGILSEDEQLKLKRVRQQLKDEKQALEASIARLQGGGDVGASVPQLNPLSARAMGQPGVTMSGSLDEPTDVSAVEIEVNRVAAVPRKSAL